MAQNEKRISTSGIFESGFPSKVSGSELASNLQRLKTFQNDRRGRPRVRDRFVSDGVHIRKRLFTDVRRELRKPPSSAG